MIVVETWLRMIFLKKGEKGLRMKPWDLYRRRAVRRKVTEKETVKECLQLRITHALVFSVNPIQCLYFTSKKE